MSGSLPHYRLGPQSYQVSATVLGGQLVTADGSSATTVSVAGAGATAVLGVAGNDASPIVSQAGNTTGYGDPLVDISVLPDYVSVYAAPGDLHVTYAANATFGALVKAAAAGTVTPWISGTDAAGLIVGRCTQPGGVTISANAVGRMRMVN